MAGQSDVDQAGDHHSDSEHPPGGQEREGEEVSHHLRGYETCGKPQTGGYKKHLSSGGDGKKPKKHEDDCETSELMKEWRKSGG